MTIIRQISKTKKVDERQRKGTDTIELKKKKKKIRRALDKDA